MKNPDDRRLQHLRERRVTRRRWSRRAGEAVSVGVTSAGCLFLLAALLLPLILMAAAAYWLFTH